VAEPIRPVYKMWNAELGAWQWGLTREDFARIQAGYGCAKCLEPFEHWVPVCYVCGEPNHAEPLATAPSYWQRQAES